MANYLNLIRKIDSIKENEMLGRESAEEALNIFEKKAIKALKNTE